MTRKNFRAALAVGLLIIACSGAALAQSGATRPRRVLPNSEPPQPTPTPTQATRTSTTAPGTSGDTTHAFTLLQQNQNEAAAREAKQIAAVDPNNAEAWKIAGFAEFNLKQYKDAALDLQNALNLQRKSGAEDANTLNALAEALARSEQFDRALPLLVTATTRAGAQPDPALLYLRGLAEFNTGKRADAERSFNAAVKADPKNTAALFYLGRIAYEQKNWDNAVAMFNRATTADARLADAWKFLTLAYINRGASATDAKADADYLNAVRASEGLLRAKPTDLGALSLNGQALIYAKQYAQAVPVLERATANANAQGPTFYLLGIAYSRTKNFPKAIAALERAAQKTPEDVSIYRELGYAYEVSKQYAKALAAYQKGASLAPDDAELKQSVERVKPFAK
jgi:tetratricopeptide (TPR) repeat protein